MTFHFTVVHVLAKLALSNGHREAAHSWGSTRSLTHGALSPTSSFHLMHLSLHHATSLFVTLRFVNNRFGCCTFATRFPAFGLCCQFRVLGAVVPPSLALSPSPPTDSTVCAVMNQSLNDEHDFTLTSQWRSHGSTMPCLQTAHRPRSLLSFAVFSASRRPAGPARR